jgi:DNA polymerase-2
MASSELALNRPATGPAKALPRRVVDSSAAMPASLHEITADTVAKAAAIKSEHKALGVVCFGYFRYRNARFGCAEVHQAIQCYGRDGMTRAREIANEMGYDMVHAMTDCAFFQKPGIKRKDATRFVRRVGQEVGVAMDVEGVYKWVVFLPSKTHSSASLVGVPNRYYGKFDDGTMKVRGIEVQRHSTPDFIYDVQQAMLDIFAEADNATEFRMRMPRALGVAKDAAEALRRRDVDPRKLGTMIQTTKAVEEYRANTNANAAMHRLRDAGTERRPGEYVKYVVTREDGPWPGRVVPVELFDEDSWFGTAKELGDTYHVAHYTRLLARSVETMLSPFGYTEDNLVAWFTGAAPMSEMAIVGRVDVPARPEWVAEQCRPEWQVR